MQNTPEQHTLVKHTLENCWHFCWFSVLSEQSKQQCNSISAMTTHLWVEDKVLGRAHVLSLGVRLWVRSRGGGCTAGQHRWYVGHVRQVAGHVVKSHGVWAVKTDVVGVVVVWQRAGHLGLLVNHLSGTLVIKKDISGEAICKSLGSCNIQT